MNVDLILSTFNRHNADYIMIGGMNFYLNYDKVLTFDVDLWIADESANLEACHSALGDLDAEVSFDAKGASWTAVRTLPSGEWLRRQGVHCLYSPGGGPLDIFRSVAGLDQGFAATKRQCEVKHTPAGVPYRSLTREGMIQCQLALAPQFRKLDRLRRLGYVPEQHE